jgi:hypothetical protein
MKEDKLIRGDAKLKKLPESRQVEIWERLNTKDETLASVCKWLAEDGLRVSRQTLSEFASWYSLRLTFKQTEEDTLNFMEFARKELPTLSDDEITRLGNKFFQLDAIKKRNPDLFLDFTTAQHNAEMDHKKFDQRERELALSREKFALETKEKIDLALDALFAEIKDNAQAVKLFNQFRAVVTKATA